MKSRTKSTRFVLFKSSARCFGPRERLLAQALLFLLGFLLLEAFAHGQPGHPVNPKTGIGWPPCPSGHTVYNLVTGGCDVSGTAANPAGSPGQAQQNANGSFGPIGSVLILDTLASPTSVLNGLTSSIAQVGTSLSLSGNTTVASTVAMQFVSGGMLICAGHTLTINGAIIAPANQQIFDSSCSGNLKINRPQALHAAWASSTDPSIGHNVLAAALPPAPAGEYANNGGGSVIYVDGYPSPVSMSQPLNSLTPVRSEFACGTYTYSGALPMIGSSSGTNPLWLVKGAAGSGQSAGCVTFKYTGAATTGPIYQFLDATSNNGGGGLRMEDVTIDGGTDSYAGDTTTLDCMDIGKPGGSATSQQYALYSRTQLRGCHTGLAIYNGGTNNPATNMWFENMNIGTDAANHHNVTIGVDFRGSAASVHFHGGVCNAMTSCFITAPHYNANSNFVVQALDIQNMTIETLGGLNGASVPQGSIFKFGACVKCSVEDSYVELEGTTALHNPDALFQVGTPPNTGTANCTAGSPIVTNVSGTAFAATDALDLMTINGCGPVSIAYPSGSPLTAQISSVNVGAHTVTLNVNASTNQTGTGMIWGGGGPQETNITNVRTYGNANSDYVVAIHNPWVDHVNILLNTLSGYIVSPTFDDDNGSNGQFFGNFSGNSGCGGGISPGPNPNYNGWDTYICGNNAGGPNRFSEDFAQGPADGTNLIAINKNGDAVGRIIMQAGGGMVFTDGTGVTPSFNCNFQGVDGSVPVWGCAGELYMSNLTGVDGTALVATSAGEVKPVSRGGHTIGQCGAGYYSTGVSTTLDANCSPLPSAPPKTTWTLGTSTIPANSCVLQTPIAYTGLATNSVLSWNPSADYTAVTGFNPASGMIYFYPWPTANQINWKACNPTSSPITPGSSTTWNVGVIL